MKQINFHSILMNVQKVLTSFSVVILFILIVFVESCNQPTQPANQPAAQPSPAPSSSANDNRVKSINSVKAYIDDIDSKLKAIDEAVRGNDFTAVSSHAGEIEDIASKIKQEAANFSTNDFELIKRDVSEIQHGGDEIKDAVKSHSHEDIHHAIETVKDHLATLKADVKL
jgi:HPt (histidine-containing phosphotransfer) domain-containing protein